MNDNGTRFQFELEPHDAGGFAKVIKGRDNYLDRDIAVKVLDPLLCKSEEADRERFRREAKILARLSHPNIPAIYDVWFEDEHFYIIFEFVSGRNLKNMLQENGPFPLSEIRRWFAQIASALEHSHSLGIIHRDIKPSNLIVTADRTSAYLVDFGIAITKEDGQRLTQAGYVIGTPGYMSPEQEASEPLDNSTDIYSLGITLYECLSGVKVPVGDYQELSMKNEAIPPEVDALIQDCFLPKGNRVSTAREFAARLAGALQPAKTLSEVLAHGRLHELTAVIEQYAAQDFTKLPSGQRSLIIEKTVDIIDSNDLHLDYAGVQLLELLLVRGILLPEDDYRQIVAPAYTWAFEKRFGDRLGQESLRVALENAAFDAQAAAHGILCQEFATFFERTDIGDKEDWYLNGLRKIIQTLMANPSCTDTVTPQLAKALRAVNKLQRSRP
jgi:serine/threonine protein kinase